MRFIITVVFLFLCAGASAKPNFLHIENGVKLQCWAIGKCVRLRINALGQFYILYRGKNYWPPANIVEGLLAHPDYQGNNIAPHRLLARNFYAAQAGEAPQLQAPPTIVSKPSEADRAIASLSGKVNTHKPTFAEAMKPRPESEPWPGNGFKKMEAYFNGFDMCRHKESTNTTECLPARDTTFHFSLKRPYGEIDSDPVFEFAHGTNKTVIDTSRFLPHELPTDTFNVGHGPTELYGKPQGDLMVPKVFVLEIGGTKLPGGPRRLKDPNSRIEPDSYGARLVIRVTENEVCVTGGVRDDVPHARTAELVRTGKVSADGFYVDTARSRFTAEPVVNRRLIDLIKKSEHTKCADVNEDEIRRSLLESPI